MRHTPILLLLLSVAGQHASQTSAQKIDPQDARRRGGGGAPLPNRHAGSKACYLAGSAFNTSLPHCNCFGEPDHDQYARRPEVVIAVLNWPGAEIDAFLLKILIEEKAGFPALLLDRQQDEIVLQNMEAGIVHIYPEYWRSESEHLYKQYVVSEAVSSCGPLGILGRNGIYTSEALVATWPDLAGWRGLRNASSAELFNHTLEAFFTDWGDPQKLLSTLELPYEVEYRGADADMYITEKLEKGEPILAYLWDPHRLLTRFALNRVQFPAYTTDEHFAQGGSDFPNDVLLKLASNNLRAISPVVHTLLLRFTITNAEQSEIMSSVADDGLEPFSASCEWLKGHRTRWQDWIPCEPGQFVAEDGRCKLCAAGTVSQQGTAKACTACLPGLFSPKDGGVACIECTALGDFYQGMAGQTACHACPSNTQRYSGLPRAENRTACQCKAGFFDADGEAGKECNRCPSGYSCAGRASQPVLASNLLRLVILLPNVHAWPEMRAAAGAVMLAIRSANILLGGVGGGEQSRTKVTPIVKYTECDVFDAATSIAEEIGAGSILGVVGPFCSLACESSAYLTSKLDIAQVSYSCTSDALSDRVKYPTFTRMASAYSSWMPAVVAFVQWCRWARLAIISTTENLFALTAPTLTRRMNDENVAVALDHRFDHGQFEVSALDRLGESAVRVAIVFGCIADVLDVARGAKRQDMLSQGWAWLGLDTCR